MILTLTGAQLKTAFLNGFAPFCDPAFAGGTGRFPQISGLKVQFHCSGTAPVVDGIWKAPDSVGGTLTPLGRATTSSGSPSTGSRRTRRSARSSKDGSSGPKSPWE